ncbi:MAG: hypothetical protein MJ114_06490 [Acetatifactor sp.]|nr:hypothetical protein [Acetatifactor sp.]
MSTLFEDLKQGLEEAIKYEKDKGKAQEKTCPIVPAKEQEEVQGSSERHDQTG